MIEEQIQRIARAVADSGGRALIVGGFVRDQLLGGHSKDYDVEIYGLRLDRVEQLLSRFGKVIRVGRAFGVLRVKGLDVDFSLPRRDNKTGRGHRGFQVELDPSLDFTEAARRRDLTINSIGLDPLTGEILDPHDGQRDLKDRRLRATDPERFSEDPLRGLRVAQIAARFEMDPDPQLVEICARLDLSELPGERLYEEFRKLLLKGVRPSRGLAFLAQSELLSFFPALDAMRGVAQDPRWHPEGDVWQHTLLVVDQAALLRQGQDDEQDLALMFAALLHDAGKPAVTTVDGDRIHAHDHEQAALPLVERLLGRLRAPPKLIARVRALIRHHLAPSSFVANGAKPRAYRRLARKLEESDVTIELLVRLARADQLGRATDDARAGRFPAGDQFLARARALDVHQGAPRDAVQGRHLVARGLAPGPAFKGVLDRCRELQDATGWTDPDQILDAVMKSDPAD